MDAVDDDAGFGDLLDSFAIGVNEVGSGGVVGLQVFVMKARPLAELSIPRLERLGGCRIIYEFVHTGSDLSHLLVVTLVIGTHESLWSEVWFGSGEQAVANSLGDVGPSVFDEVFVGKPSRLQGREVQQPVLLPTRLERRKPLRIDWLVVAHIDRGRGALEHEQLATGTRQVRNALHRRCARTDDANPLVGQFVHRSPRRVATCVVVVPPAGVEAVPSERLDSRDPRKLRAV